MSTANVLVVEDEELMRAILRQLLEGDGYTVFTADTARSALDIIAGNNIDLTITDIKMPEMTGIELLEELRKLGYDKPVLVVSGNLLSSYEQNEIAELGASLLEKPFLPKKVREVVKNLLEP